MLLAMLWTPIAQQAGVGVGVTAGCEEQPQLQVWLDCCTYDRPLVHLKPVKGS